MNAPTAYIRGNIFVELGLAKLSEERKMTLLEQMNTLIHKRIMLRIMGLISPDTAESIANDATLTKEQQMEKILSQVPQFSDLVVEEVEKVKNELQASVTELEV